MHCSTADQAGCGFSEDVDVTVFRDDLGEDYSIEQIKEMSRKKRHRARDDIKAACEISTANCLSI